MNFRALTGLKNLFASKKLPLPADFDEISYLNAYADVRAAVDAGIIASGAAHFRKFGRPEGRQPRPQPPGSTPASPVPVPTHGRDGLPFPPGDLMFLVTNGRDPVRFEEAGQADLALVRRAMTEAGVTLPKEGAKVLDWGCGCGRLARHWAADAPNVQLFGCDIDASLIGWCQANLPFGQFTTSSFDPPLDFPDGSFDLIYGISVVTHLTFEEHYRWMREIHRLLKPTGIAVLTAHGPTMFPQILEGAKAAFEGEQGFVRTTLIDEDVFIGLEHAAGSNTSGNVLTGDMFAKIFSCFDIRLHRPRFGLMGIHDTYVISKKSNLPIGFHDELAVFDVSQQTSHFNIGIDLGGATHFTALADIRGLFFPAKIKASFVDRDTNAIIAASEYVDLSDKIAWTGIDCSYAMISIDDIPVARQDVTLLIEFVGEELREIATLRISKAVLY